MIFLFNKFQYHIIAVSFLRSAVRIYKSVNYKMFFSNSLPPHFQYRKGIRLAANQSCCFSLVGCTEFILWYWKWGEPVKKHSADVPSANKCFRQSVEKVTHPHPESGLVWVAWGETRQLCSSYMKTVNIIENMGLPEWAWDETILLISSPPP